MSIDSPNHILNIPKYHPHPISEVVNYMGELVCHSQQFIFTLPCLFLFLVFSPRKRKRTFETQHVIDFLLLQYTNPPPRFKTTWLVQWPLRWQHSAFWYVSLPSRSLM